MNIQGCTVFTHILAFFFFFTKNLQTFLKILACITKLFSQKHYMNVYTLSILFHKFLFPDTGNGSKNYQFFGVSFTERNSSNAFVADLGGC